MNFSTKKWIYLKISSVILIPLMLWFIINFISIYDKNFDEVVYFITKESSKFLVSVLIVVAFFFSALSISEIFEDYIHDKNKKKIFLNLLYFFAILIPFLTIILILNLTK